VIDETSTLEDVCFAVSSALVHERTALHRERHER